MYELVYGREVGETVKTVICNYCNGEIYAGESFGTDGVKCICDECIKDLFAKLPLTVQFEMMGFEAIEGVANI